MTLSAVLAWANTHWNLVSALLALLAYAALNLAVARTPVEKREGSLLLKILDRLSTLTMRGAVNRTSAPLLGRSITEEMRALLADEAARRAALAKGFEQDLRDLEELQREVHKREGRGGFVAGPVLRAIATVVILVAVVVGPLLSLPGCPMPAPDGCTPRDTRCSPAGIPEVCSATQRWSHAPPGSSCADRGPVVCCLARSPWGREVHACVPASECLAVDGGAL